MLADAAAAAKPVHMHVERFNPARRLYDRLGFRQIADQGVYLQLEWKPTAIGWRGQGRVRAVHSAPGIASVARE